jgi:hypothetical protein
VGLGGKLPDPKPRRDDHAGHPPAPGRVVDPGHCRDCAREADLLDHYWQVQREEQAFKEARRDLAGSRR